jgi:hypothetical protein
MRDSALPVRTRRQPFSGSSNSARWGSPVRARHAPSAEPLLHAGVSSSQRETRRGPCPQNVRSRPARRARSGHLTARRRRADSCMLLPLLPDDQAAPRAARSISRLRRLLLSRRGRRDGRVPALALAAPTPASPAVDSAPSRACRRFARVVCSLPALRDVLRPLRQRLALDPTPAASAGPHLAMQAGNERGARLAPSPRDDSKQWPLVLRREMSRHL